jgi:hypothetical protein
MAQNTTPLSGTGYLINPKVYTDLANRLRQLGYADLGSLSFTVTVNKPFYAVTVYQNKNGKMTQVYKAQIAVKHLTRTAVAAC